MRTGWAVVALLLVAPVDAAELLSVNVDFADGVYSMRSEVRFDAPLEQVYAVFETWNYSTQFSRAIVEARDVPAVDDGRPGYYSKYKGCVLFFCRSYVRHGFVEREPLVAVRAEVDPERSDFSLSDEEWTFTAGDDGTTVVYTLRMRPKFWVPKGIGPYFIKRKLKSSGGKAIDRIEAIAQALVEDDGAAQATEHASD